MAKKVENIQVCEDKPKRGMKTKTPTLSKRILALDIRLKLLERRFDRLVDAVSKSKRTKGI